MNQFFIIYVFNTSRPNGGEGGVTPERRHARTSRQITPKKFVSPISLKFMGIFGWNLVGTRIGSILCHFYHFLFQIPPQKFCIKFWKKSQNRPPRRSNAPQMTKNEENAWYGPKKCPHQISVKNSQYFFLFRFFGFSVTAVTQNRYGSDKMLLPFTPKSL